MNGNTNHALVQIRKTRISKQEQKFTSHNHTKQ